jgi:hypothetical protein
MTKKERQVREVEAALDGEPRPLSPLERIEQKIRMFRRRTNSGVTIHLSPEEADALYGLFHGLQPRGSDEWPDMDRVRKEIHREASRYGLGRKQQ